jgi:hypothetical protein
MLCLEGKFEKHHMEELELHMFFRIVKQQFTMILGS